MLPKAPPPVSQELQAFEALDFDSVLAQEKEEQASMQHEGTRRPGTAAAEDDAMVAKRAEIMAKVAAAQAAMARAAETDGAAEEGIREEPQGRGRGPWGGGGEGGSPGGEVLTDSSGDEFHGMPPTSPVAFIYTTEHAPMQMRFRMSTITITDPLRQHRRHLEAPTNVRRLHR